MQVSILWCLSWTKSPIYESRFRASSSPARLCEDIPVRRNRNLWSRPRSNARPHPRYGQTASCSGGTMLDSRPRCLSRIRGKFAELSGELEERLLLVMRVYFEKPRTTVGWKGSSWTLASMVPATSRRARIARSFLGEVLDMGIPTATELPIGTPRYLADSLCWAAIGARTRNPRPTARWLPVSPCRSASRMRPEGISRPQSMES